MGATPSSSSILSGFSLYKPSISGGIPHGYGNPQYPSIPPINRHGPSPRLKKSSKIIQNHHGPSIALARINAIFRCCASCACGFLGLWCSGFFKTVGYANPKHIFFRAARTSSYLCWGCYLYPHATRVNTKITGIFSRYGQLTWLNVPQQMVSTPLNPQLQHFLVLKRWTITWGEQVWATNTSSMAKDWSLGPLAHSDVLCLLHPNMIWLVVWTPLKNISQLGWLFPIYGKIKNGNQTTNQWWKEARKKPQELGTHVLHDRAIWCLWFYHPVADVCGFPTAMLTINLEDPPCLDPFLAKTRVGGPLSGDLLLGTWSYHNDSTIDDDTWPLAKERYMY